MGQQVQSTSLQGLLLGKKRSICVWDSRALASRHRWGRGSVQPVMVTAGPGRRQRWKPSSAVPCRASLGSLELAVLQKDFMFIVTAWGTVNSIFKHTFSVLKGAAETFFALGLLFLFCLASRSQSLQQSWLADLGCLSSCDCSGCCEQMQTIPRVIPEGRRSCAGAS